MWMDFIAWIDDATGMREVASGASHILAGFITRGIRASVSNLAIGLIDMRIVTIVALLEELFHDKAAVYANYR